MQQKTNPTENVQILPFHSIVRHEVHDLIETTVIVDPLTLDAHRHFQITHLKCN